MEARPLPGPSARAICLAFLWATWDGLTSLLMSFAVGFAGVLRGDLLAQSSEFSSTTRRPTIAVDFALTYKRVGLPVGLLVLLVALSYLGTLWMRRQLRKSITPDFPIPQ